MPFSIFKTDFKLGMGTYGVLHSKRLKIYGILRALKIGENAGEVTKEKRYVISGIVGSEVMCIKTEA